MEISFNYMFLLWTLTFFQGHCAIDPCQIRVIINETIQGNINKPLFPNTTGAGMYSCWNILKPNKDKYALILNVENIDFRGRTTESISFKGTSQLYKKKKAPFCILYKLDSICNTVNITEYMFLLYPECKSSYFFIDSIKPPVRIELSSALDTKDSWEKEGLNFTLKYNFINCIVENKTEDPNGNTTGNHQCQKSNSTALALAILFAICLLVSLIALLIYIRRYRKLESYQCPENFNVAVSRNFENQHQSSNPASDGKEVVSNQLYESNTEQIDTHAVYAVVNKNT